MKKTQKIVVILAGFFLLASPGLALARGGGAGGGMGAGGMAGSRSGASMSGQGMAERMERGQEGIGQGKKEGTEHRATPAKPATPANPTPGTPGATPAVPATPAAPARK